MMFYFFLNVVLNQPNELLSLYVTEESGVGSSSAVPSNETPVDFKVPVSSSESNVVPNVFWSMPESLFDRTTNEVKVLNSHSSHISDGHIFKNKEELKLELGKICITECFEYKVERSSKTRFEASCLNDGCEWRIRAYMIENTDVFQVRYFKDQHTCSRTQTYPHIRQANKKVLGNLIKDQFKDSGRIYRPNDIVTDIKEKYKIDISYSQGWRAKSFALELLTGSPEDSFARLPVYCHNLKKTNPGTVTHTLTDAAGRFEMFFIALGVAIRSFVGYLRPLVIIDGAHLKGKFLGTMFLAVGMDGNNQILPIAYGVGKTESGESWSWFLSRLKDCIGENPNLAIISDRAASIAQAIRDVFPHAYHGLCCRHLMMNLNTKARSKKTFECLWWKTCKAYRVSEFNEGMRLICAAGPTIYNTLVNIGFEKWARAHSSGQRYNVMTSNSAESINALSVNARKLPIIKLIEFFRESLQKWYYNRRQVGANNQHPLTRYGQGKISKRISKSGSWRVSGIDQNKFEVDDGGKKGVVDLGNRTCTCNQWQLSGLPCGHVICVSRYLNQTDCSHWALNWFSTEFYRGTYQEIVNPLPDQTEWEISQDYFPIQPPLMNKRQAGRPRENRRIPSVGEVVTPSFCTRCRNEGHTRVSCN
ncbi:hypothetical protein L1987_52401 [Smallanthus sonchifolius]|uniref:Uncharacterized protein n=1 Tax=Smallanthus sonchifolius TaxID=185202 RepID=A0ACB9ESD6_9ASTR|nr:hypothetical protein L1987_52401 [Smallanthus sonchifolius]